MELKRRVILRFRNKFREDPREQDLGGRGPINFWVGTSWRKSRRHSSWRHPNSWERKGLKERKITLFGSSTLLYWDAIRYDMTAFIMLLGKN